MPTCVTTRTPPRPPDEAERLQALYRARILHSEAENVFDDLARIAALLCRTPIAAVNFLDEDVQFCKAAVGIDRAQGELPRDATVCAYTILTEQPLMITDLAADRRTADSAGLAGPLRFYAGAPITTRSGHRIGTVCVLDVAPRELDDYTLDGLAALGRQAGALLEWRLLRPSLSDTLSVRLAR